METYFSTGGTFFVIPVQRIDSTQDNDFYPWRNNDSIKGMYFNDVTDLVSQIKLNFKHNSTHALEMDSPADIREPVHKNEGKGIFRMAVR